MTVLNLLSFCSCDSQAAFEALLHMRQQFSGGRSAASSWRAGTEIQDAYGFHELFHVILTHLLALQLGVAPNCLDQFVAAVPSGAERLLC